MKTPHLTLRDLFWLVLVAGIGCAWWVERSRLTDESRAWRQVAEGIRRHYEQVTVQPRDWEVLGKPWVLPEDDWRN